MQSNAWAEFTSAASPAAINWACGFAPVRVSVYHEDNDVVHTWVKGMSAGTAITDAGSAAAVTTNGISTFADGTGTGVTIGTNCQEASKKIRVIAERGDFTL